MADFKTLRKVVNCFKTLQKNQSAGFEILQNVVEIVLKLYQRKKVKVSKVNEIINVKIKNNPLFLLIIQNVQHNKNQRDVFIKLDYCIIKERVTDVKETKVNQKSQLKRTNKKN